MIYFVIKYVVIPVAANVAIKSVLCSSFLIRRLFGFSSFLTTVLFRVLKCNFGLS